jgi:hypothetical protein
MAFDSRSKSFDARCKSRFVENELGGLTPAEKKALKADMAKERPEVDTNEYQCWSFRAFENVHAEKKKGKDGVERVVRVLARWNTFEIVQLYIDDEDRWPGVKELCTVTILDMDSVHRLTDLVRPGQVGEHSLDDGTILKFDATSMSFEDGGKLVRLDKSEFVPYEELQRQKKAQEDLVRSWYDYS